MQFSNNEKLFQPLDRRIICGPFTRRRGLAVGFISVKSKNGKNAINIQKLCLDKLP